MKHVMSFLVFGFFMAFGFFALAQVAVPPMPVCGPEMDFWQCLGLSVGSFNGASTLLIVALSVQLLIKLLNSNLLDKLFSGLDGWLKLTIISGLTIVGAVVGLMYSSNMSIWAALTSGTVLTAIMVFANQIYQHFAPAAPVASLKK